MISRHSLGDSWLPLLRRLRAPKLDIENSGILSQFWRKSDLKALLAGAPEGSVLWEYDVTAVLTNLPTVLQHSHGPKLLS